MKTNELSVRTLVSFLALLTGFLNMTSATAATAKTEPQSLPYRQEYSWTAKDYGKTFEGEGWTAILTGQTKSDGSASATLKVTYDGKSTKVTLETAVSSASDSPSGTIAVLPLDYGSPSLIFAAYSGGAHCCTEVVAVVPGEKKLQEVSVGEFEGGGPLFEDIDRDGIFEIIDGDTRFTTGSVRMRFPPPPPQFLALNETKFVDVTKEKRFQSRVRDALIRKLAKYNSDGESGQGVIAGLLATASLAGNYNSVKASIPQELLSATPDYSYGTCDPPECATAKTYETFDEALTDRLAKWGYDLHSHIDKPSLNFFGKLAEAGSYGGSAVEESCEQGPTKFEVMNDRWVRISSYEMSCDIEQAASLNGTVAAMALCSGEGIYSTQGYLLSQSGNKLSITKWSKDISEILPPNATSPRVLSACK